MCDVAKVVDSRFLFFCFGLDFFCPSCLDCGNEVVDVDVDVDVVDVDDVLVLVSEAPEEFNNACLLSALF